MVTPGETIELNVQLNERLADAFFLTCKITVEGRAAAAFNFACTLAKPE
jgi:3-hydroxyacyl-[acyl-carrier-protein] dehydratase